MQDECLREGRGELGLDPAEPGLRIRDPGTGCRTGTAKGVPPPRLDTLRHLWYVNLD